MRTSLATRLAGSIAGLAFLLSVGAPSVLAKEGVEVNLAAPISSDAQPGDVVAVFFTLTTISDAGTSPLRGSPVFIRLHGSGGAVTEGSGLETSTPGTYKAMVEIPAGGALGAEFGLHGFTTDTSGRQVRSDIVWPYDGILVAAQIPAPVDPKTFQLPGAKPAPAGDGAQPAATDTSTAHASGATATVDLRIVVAAALAAVLVVGAFGWVVGRRRLHRSSPGAGFRIG